MMKTRVLLVTMTALCLCAVVSGAFAADMVAPSWRGQAGTTFQQWNFSSDANPAAPDFVNNAYGSPSASITVGDFGCGWFEELPGFGSATGYWDLGSEGTIALDINSGSATEVWVQVAYFLDMSQAPVVNVANGTWISGDTHVVESMEFGGGWFVDQSVWQIAAGSNLAITFIGSADFGSLVDSVVVDTNAVPEPASLVAMLAGLGGMLIRRRRS